MWLTWQNCDLFNENETGLICLWLCDRCDKIVTCLTRVSQHKFSDTVLSQRSQFCNFIGQVTILSHWSQIHKQIKLASFSLNKSQFCHNCHITINFTYSSRISSNGVAIFLGKGSYGPKDLSSINDFNHILLFGLGIFTLFDFGCSTLGIVSWNPRFEEWDDTNGPRKYPKQWITQRIQIPDQTFDGNCDGFHC